jgi:hypothetical protein
MGDSIPFFDSSITWHVVLWLILHQSFRRTVRSTSACNHSLVTAEEWTACLCAMHWLNARNAKTENTYRTITADNIILLIIRQERSIFRFYVAR